LPPAISSLLTPAVARHDLADQLRDAFADGVADGADRVDALAGHWESCSMDRLADSEPCCHSVWVVSDG
jgi:hypothetical protein